MFEGAPTANEEVMAVLSPSPPTLVLSQSPTPPAPTPEPSLVAEPRFSSPLTRVDHLGSDKTPPSDEEFIKIGAKVRLTASTLSNKKMAG